MQVADFFDDDTIPVEEDGGAGNVVAGMAASVDARVFQFLDGSVCAWLWVRGEAVVVVVATSGIYLQDKTTGRWY